MQLENPLLGALERMGCGALILDEHGHVETVNAIAGEILAEQDGATSSIRDQLKTMLRQNASRFRLDSEAWVMVARDGLRPIALHAVPVGTTEDPYARTVLIIVDLENHPQPSPVALRRMFQLTAAEAALAILIGQGESPAEVALAKGVSLATIRTQLAAVFAKTRTRRQADLVALLARVAILP